MTGNKPAAYDYDAYPVLVPPLVAYRPDGALDPRGVFLLAWRKAGEDWEALVTWTTSVFLPNTAPIHVKHVQWVPSSRIATVPAEETRDGYKRVPRFAEAEPPC